MRKALLILGAGGLLAACLYTLQAGEAEARVWKDCQRIARCSGPIVRYCAAFGQDRLLVNDPKALHYMLVGANAYDLCVRSIQLLRPLTRRAAQRTR